MTDYGQALERALEVKARYETALLRKANVVGVGVGFIARRGKLTEQVGLIVNVRRKMPRSQLAKEDIIPAQLEGITVDVNEVGDLKAL